MSLTSQLKSAILSHDNETVSKLLGKMNIEAVNRKEGYEAALHVACTEKNQEALELLLARVGINVNVEDGDGRTPLLTAFSRENLQAIDKLLDRPETVVNAKTSKVRTPLHMACSKNLHETVRKLLASPGIEVNARDEWGDTPIMDCASFCTKVGLAAMLDDPRVNLDIKDKNGMGLEQKVGFYIGNSKEKDTCLEMIKNERMRRQNGEVGQGQDQTGQVESIGKYIAKIEKINKDIGLEEGKCKNNLDTRKRKMEDLAKKHEEESSLLEKKHKEESSLLEKNQRHEIIALRDDCTREDRDEQRYIASLKERRHELAEQLEKLTNDDGKVGKAASSDERSKLEPITRSLECPVCMELMRPSMKIWMCHFSHIVCEVCKDKLEAEGRKCPICTSRPFIGRNYMAEDLARTVFKE